MTVLTDAVIDKILTTNKQEYEKNEEKLLITHFDEKCLTPVGYDLRVGSEIVKVNFKKMDIDKIKLEVGQEFEIFPHEMVAIKTEEEIGMPKNKMYSGIIVSKVSFVEKGLSHISTSLDPDWYGELVVTLFNHSFRTIKLKRGEPFCTMILLKNEERSVRSSGKTPGGHIEKLYDEWNKAKKEYEKARKMKMIKLLAGIPLVAMWVSLAVYPEVKLLIIAIGYSAMYLYYTRNILKEVFQKHKT